MKRLAIIAALIGLASGVQAQRQTFLLPSYFTTNVFLHDNTNTPLHTRIQNAEATNASGWSVYVATTNANFAGLSITNLGSVQMKTNPVTTTWTNEANVYWDNTWDTLAIVTGEKNTDGTPVIDEVDFNSYVWVKNVSGAVISNGVAVAIIPDSGGVLTVSPATYPTNANVIGVTTHDIASGAEARVNYFGPIGQAKTYGLNENCAIYLATNYANGINWTTNKTGGPKIGYVSRAASSPTSGNGTILVEVGSGNGTKLDELVGDRLVVGDVSVSSIQSTATGSLVNAVVSGSLSVHTNAFGSTVSGWITGSSVISNQAYGASQNGYVAGSAGIGMSYGASQSGYVTGEMFINELSHGARQYGFASGTANIDRVAYGAEQSGYFVGSARITSLAIGAKQIGGFYGTAVAGAMGSIQIGHINAASTATNLGVGAVQLMGPITGGAAWLTDIGANGSLLVGPGTNSVAFSVKASGGFYGDGSNVTNVNAAQLGGVSAAGYVTLSAFQSTVTNYARFLTSTAPPATPTSAGSHGELRVDTTNLYIYIGAAGTNMWLRVPGSFTW